jgi:hypothetical protein
VKTIKTEGGGWVTVEARLGTFVTGLPGRYRDRTWVELACYKSDGSGRGVKLDTGSSLRLLWGLALVVVRAAILRGMDR